MNPVLRNYGLMDLLPAKIDMPDEGCTHRTENGNQFCFDAGTVFRLACETAHYFTITPSNYSSTSYRWNSSERAADFDVHAHFVGSRTQQDRYPIGTNQSTLGWWNSFPGWFDLSIEAKNLPHLEFMFLYRNLGISLLLWFSILLSTNFCPSFLVKIWSPNSTSSWKKR